MVSLICVSGIFGGFGLRHWVEGMMGLRGGGLILEFFVGLSQHQKIVLRIEGGILVQVVQVGSVQRHCSTFPIGGQDRFLAPRGYYP